MFLRLKDSPVKALNISNLPLLEPKDASTEVYVIRWPVEISFVIRQSTVEEGWFVKGHNKQPNLLAGQYQWQIAAG